MKFLKEFLKDNMSKHTKSEFGKWRSFLWPIHSYELKKLLPMFLMFFFMTFNYTILRDTKDALIITAPGSGVEVIPFIKFWGVLPSAIVFMLLYSKLSNFLSRPALFYVSISSFLLFFTLFTFLIYPAREYLHPTKTADVLQSILPNGFMGFIAIYRHWSFALFYILSELWSSIAISLLFWGFANDIMKVTEAKRFYSILGFGANLALLFSGPCVICASSIREKVPSGTDAWGVALNYLMSMVVVSGICIIFLYWWIQKQVLTDTKFFDSDQHKLAKKLKPKLSLKESFIQLSQSRYLVLLAVLVVAYGFCINIVEVTWKEQVKLQYPNPNDFSTFRGVFSTCTGFMTILMTLFVGGNTIRYFGWRVAALVTPITLFITGLLFFFFIIFKDSMGGIITYLGTSPLMLAVIVGALQSLLTKTCKYSLFDPTKEMAYIPLDEESKVKGKAAIDVVGSRLGKAGGSLVQQGLILILGSISAMTPYIAAILFAIILLWIFSANALSKLFQAKSTEVKESKMIQEPSN